MSHRQHMSTRGASAQQLVPVGTTRLDRDGVGSEQIAARALQALAPEIARIHRTIIEKTRGGLNAE